MTTSIRSKAVGNYKKNTWRTEDRKKQERDVSKKYLSK